MPVTIVVGGQFGSEGKGKVAYHLAREESAAAVVRVGGPNSGHTVVRSGVPSVLRQLPTASFLPDVQCVIPAGGYVDLNVVLTELTETGLPPNQLLIDPSAMIVTQRDREAERAQRLRERIGSTLSGTGAAVLRRIARQRKLGFAADEASLRSFVHPTAPILRDHLERGRRVIIEGTQGFGLSILHGGYYPHCTSRDTTAAGFLSEAGLSPLDVDDVVLVVRSFPIRVAGLSGPLHNEITWDDVTSECGATDPILEFTSVTRMVRRVARFDPNLVLRAVRANQPTRIVLNHLDYIDYRVREHGTLTDRALRFVDSVEAQLGRGIDLLGTSPESLIPRKPSFQIG